MSLVITSSTTQNKQRKVTTCPIRLIQIVPQGGEWTRDISTSPTDLQHPKTTGARELLTDEKSTLHLGFSCEEEGGKKCGQIVWLEKDKRSIRQTCLFRRRFGVGSACLGLRSMNQKWFVQKTGLPAIYQPSKSWIVLNPGVNDSFTQISDSSRALFDSSPCRERWSHDESGELLSGPRYACHAEPGRGVCLLRHL